MLIRRRTATSHRTPRSPSSTGHAVRPSAGQTGNSLIENMAALVVLSLGLLGLAGMQLQSIKDTNNAKQRSVAFQLAEAMGDRMRANRDAAREGDYNVTISPDRESTDGKSRSQKDVSSWRTQLEAALPEARAAIEVEDNGETVIAVRWADNTQQEKGSTSKPMRKDLDDDDSAEITDAPTQVEVQTRL